MRIGETIKCLRKNLHMTQKEFAISLESSQTAISEYESGVKTPSLRVAQRILRLAKSNRVKLTLDDIFQDEH